MIDREILVASATKSVENALAEDCGAGDISAALIPDDVTAHARVITRDAGVFCGAIWIEETARQVDSRITVTMQVADGDKVQPEQTLFELIGPASSLLTAERTMLNFVQLLSGTATKTAHFAQLIAHTSTTLLDTRKTIPGLRIAQKYAVTCGGGENHRLGLYDAYLLKENHIAAAGSITQAVDNAKQANPNVPVEVEVETIAQLMEVMTAGADIAMVDNFSLDDTVKAVKLAAGKVKLEASGGIDEQSIVAIANTGVDYISIGALTKNVEPLDLSMRFVTGSVPT